MHLVVARCAVVNNIANKFVEGKRQQHTLSVRIRNRATTKKHTQHTKLGKMGKQASMVSAPEW